MTENKNVKNAAGHANRSNSDVIEIDLVELWHVIRANIVKVVICALIGALLTFSYAYFLIEPTYQSTAKLYVVSASNDSVVNLSDLDIGTSLTKDYEELILSYTVLDEVIDNLKLDTDYKELAKLLTLENPADTRVLRITATTTDPKLSQAIANEVATVTIRYLPDTMSANPPNIAQRARVEEDKVAPSLSKYTMIGALIGLLLAIMFYIIRYVMDDTVRSAEDMEKLFGTTPLTEIPFNEKAMNKKDGKKNSKGKKKGVSK